MFASMMIVLVVVLVLVLVLGFVVEGIARSI